MSTAEILKNREYKYGWVTDIEAETIPRGLSEDTVRLISAKKNEPSWMLEFRLKAYRNWLKMEEPRRWPNIKFPEVNYQDMIYYSAPKQREAKASLDEVDPELLRTFEKLGIPLSEQKQLAGVAVDAVFDSVSVATTYKEKLRKVGVIFCSFSEAVQEHPEIVRKYLGSVVPTNDNFYAALNSAVFSDGSFCFIPKGVRCPMELSTYFRINNSESGQFERTLIVAEESAYVSYLEGCTAPKFDRNQLHAAVVELVALDGTAPIAAAALARSGGAVTRAALDTGGFRFGKLMDYLDANFLPGGAKYGDLPGLLSLSAPTTLWLAGESAESAALTKKVYVAAGAGKAITCDSSQPDEARRAAIEWLIKAFGFEKKVAYAAENGDVMHAELTHGNGMIMLGTSRDDELNKYMAVPSEIGGRSTGI